MKAKPKTSVKTTRSKTKSTSHADAENERVLEALRESEAKYHAFFQNSLDAILLTMPDGSIQSANPAACKMLGRTEAEICALGRGGLVDLNDPRVATLLEERARTGKAFGELTMFRNDGSPFPAEMSSALFQDGQGNTRTSMIIRDISERKRAEEAQRASEQQYRQLFETSPVAIYLAEVICDAEGQPNDLRFLYVNPAFERLVHSKAADLVGRTAVEFFPQYNRATVERQGWVALTGVSDHWEAFSVALGSHFETTVYSPRHGQLVTQIVDITERKRAEEQIRYQASLLENVNDAIMAADASYVLKAWNTAAEKMYGWTAEEVIGQNGTNILQTQFSGADADEMRGQIAEAGHYFGEATQLRKDGSRIPVEMASIVLRDEAGQITDYVSVVRDITERKLAEESLRLYEERFASAFHTSPAGLTIARIADGKFVEANEAFCKMLGFSRAEVIGHTSTELNMWTPDERKRLIAEQVRSGGLYNFELRVQAKSGRSVNMLLSSKSMDLEGGAHYITTMIDITERKQAEKALQDSQARVAGIINSAMDAIISIDAEQRIVLFNPAAEAMFHCAQAEALGQPLERFLPARFRGGHAKHIQQFTQTGVSSRAMGALGTIYGLREGGEEFPIEASISQKIVAGQSISTVILRDITERKKAEETLEYQAKLIESMNDAIVATDTEYHVTAWNRTAEALLGWTAAEVLGRNAPEILQTEFPAGSAADFRQSIAATGSWRGEITQLHKNGTRIPLGISSMTLHDALGQISGFVSVVRDMTERKQAEAEIRKLNEELEGRVILRTQQLEAANKELEAFSYSVSHDLRAPLRSIDGFSQALLEDYGDQLPDEGHAHLARVRAAAQRMAELIDDLLNLSRVTRAPFEPGSVDLSRLAQNIASELQRSEPGRGVEFSITPDLSARGDARLLQIALENLLNNAWKFTSKKGQARIEFGSKNENGQSIYFVRDNGAGFDMTYAEKLFGAFQRLHAMTEYPGTGIGLATVQRIIHRHGGRVWAEGAIDQGATFYFSL